MTFLCPLSFAHGPWFLQSRIPCPGSCPRDFDSGKPGWQEPETVVADFLKKLFVPQTTQDPSRLRSLPQIRFLRDLIVASSPVAVSDLSDWR